MWAIDSPRAKPLVGSAWIVFAAVNTSLMYLFPGEETIPYHLVWASFALLYGLFTWSRATTWVTFSVVTVATGIALVKHAMFGFIGWEECSEIVLMDVLVALLIWHVNRQQTAQTHLAQLRDAERIRSDHREVAARFGSHEVRTRLTIARSFAELVRDAATDESMRRDSAVVLGELDKATALTTQLLTLVRVETSASHTPAWLVDVDELIDQVGRRWSATADRTWAWSSRVGAFLGDSERLEAALDCLIENAVKFTAVSDSIHITVRLDDDELSISVQDSGCGMPAKDVARVTKIFQTGSMAGARAGSGLGLAIVQAITDARGGTLDVASGVGIGTCVTIRVPAGVRAQRGSPAPDTDVAQPSLSGPRSEAATEELRASWGAGADRGVAEPTPV